MNWTGVINWLLSGLGAGLAVFFASVFAAGVPDRDAVLGALAGAGAAMINHLRQNPIRQSTDGDA
jgi:hypothetical protein